MTLTATGIDIGGTRVKAALVNESGQVLEQRAAPTPTTVDGFSRLLTEMTAAWPDVVGVGFGCKGIVGYESTEVLNSPGPIRFLEGRRLAALAGFEGRAWADNDARVAMLGEMLWGAAKGTRNALMLTLGTGVGGAVLADGVLLRGSHSIAGHLGHITVDPMGARCMCGNRGCLETVFSARAIESAAFAATHAGVASTLPPGATCADVFQHAAQGDRASRDIVARGTAYLAAAIAGLLMIFDPERVIIGGQISQSGEALFAPLRDAVWDRTVPFLRRQVPLVPAASEDPSGVRGAAALVFNAVRAADADR